MSMYFGSRRNRRSSADQDRLPIDPEDNMENFFNSGSGDEAMLMLLEMLASRLGMSDLTPKPEGRYDEEWMRNAFHADENLGIYAEVRRLWQYIGESDPVALWIRDQKMALVDSRKTNGGATVSLWHFGCIQTFVWQEPDGTLKPVHNIRWMSMIIALKILDLMVLINNYDEAVFNQLLFEYDGFDVLGGPEAAARLRQTIDFDQLKTTPVGRYNVEMAWPFLRKQGARGITPWDFYQAIEAGILDWNEYEWDLISEGMVKFWEYLKEFDLFLNEYAKRHSLTRRRKYIIRTIALKVIRGIREAGNVAFSGPGVEAVAAIYLSTLVYDEDPGLALQHAELAADLAADKYGQPKVALMTRGMIAARTFV